VKFELASSKQISSKISSLAALKASRTPPHKKFRKLRLFDTPHTPKTLIKKSEPVSVKKSTTIQANTTACSSSVSSSSSESVTQKPQINIKKEEIKSSTLTMMMDSEELSSPPCSSQQERLFTDIIGNVNQTPKNLRRTPASGLLRPNQPSIVLMRPQQTIANQQQQLSYESEMEIEHQYQSLPPNYNQIYNSINKTLKNSSSRVKNMISQTQAQSATLRMRLFEDQQTIKSSLSSVNGIGVCANKVLNFDDTEDTDCESTSYTIKTVKDLNTNHQNVIFFLKIETLFYKICNFLLV
jgi:hypothetical protein